MSFHTDTPIKDETTVFTVVYTLRSAVSVGGNLIVSKRDDGDVKYGTHKTIYKTQHNTMYALFGSHVKHTTQPVTTGHRYAFVLFYSSQATLEDVVVNWIDKPTPFVCLHCCRCYANRRNLLKHNREHHRVK